jgi:hypothetical protein
MTPVGPPSCSRPWPPLPCRASPPTWPPVFQALHQWLDGWKGNWRPGDGHEPPGLRPVADPIPDGWRCTFYPTGREHSLTSRAGSAWEKTAALAVQRAGRARPFGTGMERERLKTGTGPRYHLHIAPCSSGRCRLAFRVRANRSSPRCSTTPSIATMKGYSFDLDNCRNAAELYRPDTEALRAKVGGGRGDDRVVGRHVLPQVWPGTLELQWPARGYPFMQGVPDPTGGLKRALGINVRPSSSGGGTRVACCAWSYSG